LVFWQLIGEGFLDGSRPASLRYPSSSAGGEFGGQAARPGYLPASPEETTVRLFSNPRRRTTRREPVGRAPLTGRIFDVDGRPMSPTCAYGRQGKLDRYYASATPPGQRRV
jgi:hypothetical protein